MFPAIVIMHTEIDLDERAPFRSFRFADQMHARFLWSAIGFPCITLDAGADNVFPRGGAISVPRNNVIQIKIFTIEDFAAVLACIAIALKNIVPREFHFLLGQPVKKDQQNDSWNADLERDCMDAVGVGFLLREISPLMEIERLIGSIIRAKDCLCVSFKKQSKSAADSANVDCLPEPIQHQYLLVQGGTHKCLARNVAHGLAECQCNGL